MNAAQPGTTAAIAATRGGAYWFLSRLLLERPEAGFLGEIAVRAAARDNDDLLLLAEHAGRAARDEGLSIDLLREYTFLLRGLREGEGPPPPYESLYREKRLMGDSTAHVMRHYHAAGFGDIVPEAGPQDHVGVELRFLSLLCYHEHLALNDGAIDRALELTARQRRFLDQQPLRWVDELCACIEDASRLPFYASVARLTRALLHEDRMLLDELDDEYRAA